MDERKYLPVERWIFSATPALNAILKPNEGISHIVMPNGEFIKFNEALDLASDLLLGECPKNKWPLTKILDIGGEPTTPSFAQRLTNAKREIPGIPCHVHSGQIIEGHIRGPGKAEAYFFPPLNVSPYNNDLVQKEHVITRLGFLPSISKDQFAAGLLKYGADDEVYNYMNIYDINAYDGWYTPERTIHAPGPYTTFEIQLPQDDFNLACCQLGRRLCIRDQIVERQSLQLKGLKDERDFIDQLLDWDRNTTPHFKQNYYRPSSTLEEGDWGRRLQIFYDLFYGEGFEIKPGKVFKRKSDKLPFAGIVWSGKGKINGNELDVSNPIKNEILVTPNTEVTIENNGNNDLLIYCVFPIKN